MTWLYLVVAFSAGAAAIWAITSTIPAAASAPASPQTTFAQACFTAIVLVCTAAPLLVYALAWPSTPDDWAVLAPAGLAVLVSIVVLIAFGYFAAMFGFLVLVNGGAVGVILMLSPLVVCAPLLGVLTAVATVALRSGRPLRFRAVALITGVAGAVAGGGAFACSTWGQL